MWRQLFYQASTGLLLAQLILLCLLAVKKSGAAAGVAAPLPFVTLVFVRAAAATFWRPMEGLSLLVAARRDAAAGAGSGQLGAARKGGDLAAACENGATGGGTAGAASTGGAAAGAATSKAGVDPYTAPAFRFDAAAHAALLADAAAAKGVAAGGDDAALLARFPEAAASEGGAGASGAV
jgi:hypothetical protein